MEETKYLTVSELNNFIHDLFLNFLHFQNICLRGEVTNFKGSNRSGHYYFSLKDEKSVISAVIFKFDSYNMDLNIKNGNDIIVTGNVSTYSASGTYQFIIKDLYLYGVGNLLLQKQKLKEKLTSLGYFDSEYKKSIPQFPTKIGIITGKNSAAAQDFKINLLRRFPICELAFYECLVQGEKAPEDIVKNIQIADNANLDLLIIGRGGGASDDLNAFDDENVVKTIFEAKTPIIAAIGHEINRTFSDYAADKYASTPTGACELAVPDYKELIKSMKQVNSQIVDALKIKIYQYEKEVAAFKANKNLSNINNLFDNKLIYLNNLKIEINNNLQNKIVLYEYKLNNIRKLINEVNPFKLLTKGYSISKNKDEQIISSIHNISLGDEIIIQMKDGIIKAKVEDIINGK